MLHNLRLLTYWPLYAIIRRSSFRDAAIRDVLRTLDLDPKLSPARALVLKALGLAQTRSVLYHRMYWGTPAERILSKILSRLLPGVSSVELGCKRIGGGFVLTHGFSSVIWAESIGEDCRIFQQVTLGSDSLARFPTLGDRVTVFAGAKILGGITIGDDAVIGANALVQRDVEPGEVLGSPRAQTIRRAPD